MLEPIAIYKRSVKITTVDFVIFTTEDLMFVYNSVCKYIRIVRYGDHLVELSVDLVPHPWTCWSPHTWSFVEGYRGMEISWLSVPNLSLGVWYHYQAMERSEESYLSGFGGLIFVLRTIWNVNLNICLWPRTTCEPNNSACTHTLSRHLYTIILLLGTRSQERHTRKIEWVKMARHHRDIMPWGTHSQG